MMGARRMVAACAAAGLLSCGAGEGRAAGKENLLRDVLRQQSPAEQGICGAVRRAVAEGVDAALVVRTAVELGFTPCQVIRCAVTGSGNLLNVIRGAGEAGLTPDVISRCAVDAGADRQSIATLLSDLDLEPNFCYFTFVPAGAPAAAVRSMPVIDRHYTHPQISPYSF